MQLALSYTEIGKEIKKLSPSAKELKMMWPGFKTIAELVNIKIGQSPINNNGQIFYKIC